MYIFPVLGTVIMPVLTWLIRDFSVFYAVHLAKVSPSDKFVTAPNVVRRDTNILATTVVFRYST